MSTETKDNSRYRTARVAAGPHAGDEITCEIHGHMPSTEQLWWLPETKETFELRREEFWPYDGPVIYGTGYSF